MAILTGIPHRPPREPRGCRRRGDLRAIRCALLILTMGGIAGTSISIAKEARPSENQVKAAFLFNFAKYVDWPAAAFPGANAPIIIGVMGEDRFDDNLRHAVEGKTVNGRPFVIKHLAADSEVSGCHILFISESEASRVGAILDKARALPMLTVGEDEPFARNGGIINFVLRNGNVRLDIDLAAAKKAGLTISSRLLAVADVVKGKTN